MTLDPFAQDILNRCRAGQRDTQQRMVAVALVSEDSTYLTEHLHFGSVHEAKEWLRAGMQRPPEDMDAWLDAIRQELGV